jgi:type III secretory pathway component EscT
VIGAAVPSLSAWLPAALLAAARMIPAILLIPGFGRHHLPLQARLALALLVTFLVVPQLTGAAAAIAAVAQGRPLGWLVLVVRELAIGVTVGFVASLAFAAVEAAGRLADTARGASMGEVLAAGAPAGESPLGVLYGLLAAVIFLEMGGLPRIIAALAESYQAIPVGAGRDLGTGLAGAAQVVVFASAKLIAAALGFAAPLLVAALLADVVLGTLGRVAPQLPVYFVGLPVKALLGVGVVLLGLGALRITIGQGFAGWWVLVAGALDAFRR